VNWTTTAVPLWQVDCENFRKTGRPFELRGVSLQEHHEFISAFSARYDLQVVKNDDSALFYPAQKGKTQPIDATRQFSA
jgi:hypothetical protein